MGIQLTEPAGLLRAKLALTTWRLLDYPSPESSG